MDCSYLSRARSTVTVQTWGKGLCCTSVRHSAKGLSPHACPVSNRLANARRVWVPAALRVPPLILRCTTTGRRLRSARLLSAANPSVRQGHLLCAASGLLQVGVRCVAQVLDKLALVPTLPQRQTIGDLAELFPFGPSGLGEVQGIARFLFACRLCRLWRCPPVVAADTFGVNLSYKATHWLLRYKLRAMLKVARPSHQKNADAVAALRALAGLAPGRTACGASTSGQGLRHGRAPARAPYHPKAPPDGPGHQPPSACSSTASRTSICTVRGHCPRRR